MTRIPFLQSFKVLVMDNKFGDNLKKDTGGKKCITGGTG